MIILKHLTVERFRLLREINLHFPQRGSILIQGPNEAGKSALLESIYFALYGETLASNPDTLDDVVLYGTAQATVTLTLSIGTTELSITRIIERGEGQQVTLHVQRAGMPAEPPITQLSTANERILAELGHVDSETLRNSCFIEQKELSRLEHLAGQQRETTLHHLLGLETLLSLTDQFTLTPHDEQLLNECTDRLKLAEIQARLPELSQQLGQLEAALDAVAITEDLAEISQQETDITEQQQSLEHLYTTRAELKLRFGRIQQFKKADATLAEIIGAYETIAEARRKLPELEQQIAALDRREREELPTLEKRVNEFADLIRSFGTLERMSNDLLSTVNTIKELEQELKQQQELQNDSEGLDEQIVEARLQVDEARQALNELEEHQRAGRPQLEARLQRLQGLRKRLTALHQAEEDYARRVMRQEPAAENTAHLNKVKKNIQETEQQLSQADNEAMQAQQQANTLEKRWRQLSVGRQLQEWQHLKELFQSLVEAEQQVMIAHQQQARLTQAALDARDASQRWLLLTIGSCVLALIAGFSIFLFISHNPVAAAALGVVVFILLAGAGYSFYNYKKVHKDELIASQQMQEATNQVSMTVAVRENAVRMSGKREALAQLEQEIRSLGSTIPRSREEAQHLLQQIQDKGESLIDLQQRVNEQRTTASTLLSQANSIKESLTALREEQVRLEEQRKQEDWDDFENKLRAEHIAIEDRQHEIATLAGQEGLPIPSFDTSSSGPLPATTNADLELAVANNIKATEREIASIDGKIDLVSDLATQVKAQQDRLESLLALQRMLAERQERFHAHDSVQEIERAREQQLALRTALQTLQDSLRERVKPLGVAFGQAAISNAETIARNQLEALHFALGRRVELQSQRARYVVVLKDRQSLLPDYYNQLARLSGSLGSWIVPPNPFAEALIELRTRCQQEIQDANEANTLQELEKLEQQEAASNTKIELCRQDIEEAQERIAAMLVQHNRPNAKAYNPTALAAVWPLVGEHTPQHRGRLEEERASLEQEVQQLEQQELALSTSLQTGSSKLDVQQERLRMQQQERSYQTKKHGNLLLKAVYERIMRQMLPRTEYYMQQILSLLTSGRYHEVQLCTKEGEEGSVSAGPFQLSVWDTAAGEYVSRSALSSGAADQLSLALRLAFAIAALPRELQVAPGFILLDDPLSSSDLRRTKALVDVVTSRTLSQHFEQILLVSHSSAFDPTMFPYHIYLDGGVVVKSNLPVVPMVEVMGVNGKGDGVVPGDVITRMQKAQGITSFANAAVEAKSGV